MTGDSGWRAGVGDREGIARERGGARKSERERGKRERKVTCHFLRATP